MKKQFHLRNGLILQEHTSIMAKDLGTGNSGNLSGYMHHSYRPRPVNWARVTGWRSVPLGDRTHLGLRAVSYTSQIEATARQTMDPQARGARSTSSVKDAEMPCADTGEIESREPWNMLPTTQKIGGTDALVSVRIRNALARAKPNSQSLPAVS